MGDGRRDWQGWAAASSSSSWNASSSSRWNASSPASWNEPSSSSWNASSRPSRNASNRPVKVRRHDSIYKLRQNYARHAAHRYKCQSQAHAAKYGSSRPFDVHNFVNCEITYEKYVSTHRQHAQAPRLPKAVVLDVRRQTIEHHYATVHFNLDKVFSHFRLHTLKQTLEKEGIDTTGLDLNSGEMDPHGEAAPPRETETETPGGADESPTPPGGADESPTSPGSADESPPPPGRGADGSPTPPGRGADESQTPPGRGAGPAANSGAAIQKSTWRRRHPLSAGKSRSSVKSRP